MVSPIRDCSVFNSRSAGGPCVCPAAQAPTRRYNLLEFIAIPSRKWAKILGFLKRGEFHHPTYV
jgi:hypothetical protein